MFRFLMSAAVAAVLLASQSRVEAAKPGPGGFNVKATICARLRALTVGGRPAIGRSRKPATPSSANRLRIRLTCTTVYPIRSAISTPDSPCSINSTARARRLSPAGVDDARWSRSSSARSAALTAIGRTWLAMNALPEHAMAYNNFTYVTEH